MKREIKFRVWDKAKRRILGVDQLAFGPDGELVSIYSDGPDFSNDSEALVGEKPDLNKAVLMEYTGLHDKNGREIYECDIVKMHQVVLSPDDKIGWVEYTDKYGYSIRFASRRCRQSDWANDEGAKYEVIGNIFENPELMEASK